MLLYYITDRRALGKSEPQQCTALLEQIARAARAGVDYIQLREKDLSPRALECLAREAIRVVRESSATTRLLINARTDVALAVGADGVHLPSDEMAASEVRAAWMRSTSSDPLIGVSAHTVSDVRYAEAHGASFAVLAPIFEKVHSGTQGIGLRQLQAACAGASLPENTESAAGSSFAVLALGGITLTNARECVRAGAAGVAGIRLFQQGDVAQTVLRLRDLSLQRPKAAVS